MSINLLSTTARVESPCIKIKIGDYVFGQYTNTQKYSIDNYGVHKHVSESFPNIVNSLEVEKVNGTVNTYTIGLEYAISPGEDPNKVDKILSSVSTTRKIVITYGDYSTPQFIYKEEEALITKVSTSLNIISSCISYTITAVSSATLLSVGSNNFPKRIAKPSDVIYEILYNEKYGLLDVFYGMRNKQRVKQLGLIASDDKSVTIEAKTNISILDYLDYLVSCMTSLGDPTNSLTDQTKYTFVVVDDFTGALEGPYFKVNKVANNVQTTSGLYTYEIDIGYPTAQIVTNFSVDTDDAYTLLYEYSEKIQQDNYSYRIDNNGNADYIYSPTLLQSPMYRPTQSELNWWSKVTQYPISATVTLKGLLRPAILMTYVKLNVYFSGRKHDSSGVYIITRQRDQISSSGYRTTLSLTRIQGDTEFQ